jgi:predicted DNA binding CopG/RHH family protein
MPTSRNRGRGPEIINPEDAELAEWTDAADRAATTSTEKKTVRITVDLEPLLHRAVKRAADEAEMPVTDYVRALLNADEGVRTELAELKRRQATRKEGK